MSELLEVYERLGVSSQGPIDSRVILSHDQRDRGRLRVQSCDGVEVRIFLERGEPLQVGERLRSSCGKHLLIEGAHEVVIRASCSDWATFSRACYHLGNRHVKVQLGERWLRILPDHVLEDLLSQIGLELTAEHAVFVPESGAYGNGSHHH